MAKSDWGKAPKVSMNISQEKYDEIFRSKSKRRKKEDSSDEPTKGKDTDNKAIPGELPEARKGNDDAE